MGPAGLRGAGDDDVDDADDDDDDDDDGDDDGDGDDDDDGDDGDDDGGHCLHKHLIPHRLVLCVAVEKGKKHVVDKHVSHWSELA